MREPATAARIRVFLRRLGASTISRLKDELAVNVELASPDLFIPVPPGWEDRSPWESTEGSLVVRHFDLYAQALAKVERGHRRDLADVAAMVERGLVEPIRAMAYFERLAPDLYRCRRPDLVPPGGGGSVRRRAVVGGPSSLDDGSARLLAEHLPVDDLDLLDVEEEVEGVHLSGRLCQP